MTNDVTIAWLGIIISFIVAFAMNMTYFSPKGLYPAWTKALGQDPQANIDRGASANMAPSFTMVTIALFVQAFTMDWLVQATAALYGHDVTIFSGLLTGLGAGIGLAAAPALGHRIFSGQGLKVWIIEVGADIAGLSLMGVVLSFFH
jgi:hypothetical protein